MAEIEHLARFMDEQNPGKRASDVRTLKSGCIVKCNNRVEMFT